MKVDETFFVRQDSLIADIEIALPNCWNRLSLYQCPKPPSTRVAYDIGPIKPISRADDLKQHPPFIPTDSSSGALAPHTLMMDRFIVDGKFGYHSKTEQ